MSTPPRQPSALALGVSMLLAIVHPAPANDFASTVMDATFKFYHKDSTSTCFLVKRAADDPACYLVTTAHTVERTKGETAILVLRKPAPDGSYTRHDHTLTIRQGETPLWVRHPKQDVAVLKLTSPLPIPVNFLPAASLADAASLAASKVRLCSPLFILTYPERFEANGAGFPVARQGIFASPPLLPIATHPTLLADFTTFAGDSGGPVFIDTANGAPLIIGIVLAQQHHVDNLKSEYEERTIRHPLGLGTVLHATYVSEALAQAAQPVASATSKPAPEPPPASAPLPSPPAK